MEAQTIQQRGTPMFRKGNKNDRQRERLVWIILGRKP
jgi:hypothetical protein